MLDYDTPDLARQVEQLSPADIHALPYGAIRLNAAGTVTFFNDAERRLSGYPGEPRDRHFFTDIAPCMNNAAFRGRIEAALQAGKLDIEFDHIGDFDDRTRQLRVRVQSAAGGGCWIFLRRQA